VTPELRAVLFGPFEIGEILEIMPGYHGMVFRSGPKRFWLIHECGDVSYHAQTYQAYRRASFYGTFDGDTEYHDNVVRHCEDELVRFRERSAKPPIPYPVGFRTRGRRMRRTGMKRRASP
jgi:hypothetical protein